MSSEPDSSPIFRKFVSRFGSSIEGYLPIDLYHHIRRYSSMYCVDGVPVLTDKPEVVLIKRLEGEFLPGWWIVGGRVPKSKRETQELKDSFKSEMGLRVSVQETDYIGRGSIFVPGNSKENPREYPINTPTSVYAVKIDRRSVAERKIITGNGNEAWKVFRGSEVLESRTIHPYVKSIVVVALDRIHGKDWRAEINPKRIRFVYPRTNREISKSYFLPLNIARL